MIWNFHMMRKVSVPVVIIVGVCVWTFAPMPQPVWAGVQPGSGLDSSLVVSEMDQRSLLRWIYKLPNSTADSIAVYYASHAGLDSAAVDSVWIGDLLSLVYARIKALEGQYLQKNAVTPAGVLP